MAINATNYDGTKDYKIAEAGDVYHPNLLINGDFLINQRGETSYKVTGGGTAYTLDMWKLTNGSGAIVSTNGSTVTIDNTSGTSACYFQQTLTGMSAGDYTQALYASGITGSPTYYLSGISSGQQAIKSGRNSRSMNGTPTAYVIYLPIGSKVTLSYCDLFKGSLSYGHVEEEYTTALLRCSRYFMRLNKSPNYYPLEKFNNSETGSLILILPITVPMVASTMHVGLKPIILDMMTQTSYQQNVSYTISQFDSYLKISFTIKGIVPDPTHYYTVYLQDTYLTGEPL